VEGEEAEHAQEEDGERDRPEDRLAVAHHHLEAGGEEARHQPASPRPVTERKTSSSVAGSTARSTTCAPASSAMPVSASVTPGASEARNDVTQPSGLSSTACSLVPGKRRTASMSSGAEVTMRTRYG